MSLSICDNNVVNKPLVRSEFDESLATFLRILKYLKYFQHVVL